MRPAQPSLDTDGHLYVFAYGSLIWRPGFAHLGMHAALLRGFHRRFCLRSKFYRGTPEAPGLVLGLDRGGACRGVAFRVSGAEAAEVLAYLDARENVANEIVYTRRLLPLWLPESGVTVRAVTYVARRGHPAYCRLGPEETASIIARGIGQAGSNRDYLLNTLTHLAAIGVRDHGLERIAALLPQPAVPAFGL